MQIEPSKLKEFVFWLLSEMEKAEKELIAYRTVFFLLEATGEFSELPRESRLDEVMGDILKLWKPKGPPN